MLGKKMEKNTEPYPEHDILGQHKQMGQLERKELININTNTRFNAKQV